MEIRIFSILFWGECIFKNFPKIEKLTGSAEISIVVFVLYALQYKVEGVSLLVLKNEIISVKISIEMEMIQLF